MMTFPGRRWVLSAAAALTLAGGAGCGPDEPIATTTEDLIEAKRQRTEALGGEGLDPNSSDGQPGDFPIRGARP